jgi:hypothetical protein
VSNQVRHPIFARMYARLSPRADARGVAEHRRELLASLSGRVLERPASLLRARAPQPSAHRRHLAARRRLEHLPAPRRGCHAARDTETAITAAGFTIEQCRGFPFKGGPITAPPILGLARRPLTGDDAA